ncbi:hypothetical protein QYF61_022842 [Mycteria americana]|uniref:small monomeric GTPase n=1 Tax=Mycteria americana TaxID=33587 RepID=A0AAN7N5Z5_MYCAM|nr:hypothetical protein QYF61_022842 [Mycteria americana]
MQMASVTDARYRQKDTSDQNFDYMFKLLIIGNSSVGKTSFLFRYADDTFTSAFVSTVGIDFKVKTVYRNDKRVKLQIWQYDSFYFCVAGYKDTAGQERYRTITTAYYRGAMGFILMYDITSEDSFNAVQDWATQIKTYSWDNAQVILVGNKCDMEDERIIPVEKGKHLADQLGFDYFEASAKENINVWICSDELLDGGFAVGRGKGGTDCCKSEAESDISPCLARPNRRISPPVSELLPAMPAGALGSQTDPLAVDFTGSFSSNRRLERPVAPQTPTRAASRRPAVR